MAIRLLPDTNAVIALLNQNVGIVAILIFSKIESRFIDKV
jgi:hypothetical protein